MKNSLDNYVRAARAYDKWLQTDTDAEEAHARDIAIENKAIEIYRDILSYPEMMAEALAEMKWNDEYRMFAQSLCDILRGEIEEWANNYVYDLRDKAGECLMDYATKQAESLYEEL